VTKYGFIADLETFLAHEFEAERPRVTPERCPAEFSGDLTVNCFRLARSLRNNPMKIATRTAEFLTQHPDIVGAETVKAFVNVTLRPEALFRDAVGDEAALLEAARLPGPDRRRVLIEFSAPNTNKPQHLGHVRNNALGSAMASILRRVGHTVTSVNLINDRGIHICKSMVAYQRWGEGRTPASEGIKGDHFVGDFYVLFEKEFQRQVACIRADRPEWRERPAEQLFLETEIGRTAQAMLLAWENGDPEVRRLWETMNAWVIEGFAETYRRMGVVFDKVYRESETYTLGRNVILEGLERGVFHRTDDGAVVIDLDAEKLGTKVVLRRDGTSVYVTQDIGATLLKQEEFQPDLQIWVVGDEQVYHFRVLFAIMRRLGHAWAERLHHMAYGMVNLPSGKMKSREGTVVDADDLFDEMTRLARDATLARAGAQAPADLDRRADAIGMAALKFMLLKVNPRSAIAFDPRASIKFEGDTGPYVMYAYARIASMFRKAPSDLLEQPVNWGVLGTSEERELALRCAEYPGALQRAAAELDASCLAGYLLDLAKAFSRFYRTCPILSAPTPPLRRARIELSARVRNILRDGLRTLTMDVLESM